MKKILLALTLFALVAGVSAQSLQNFDYSPSEEDYPVELTGGESFTQVVNFTSESDQRLPLGVRVTVESEDTNFEEGGSAGVEFNLTGNLTDSEDTRKLIFNSRINDGNLVYVGSLQGDNLLEPQSENSVEIEVDSHPAISPDSFDFRFDVRSAPGFGSETNSTKVENGSASVGAGSVSVNVNTDRGENVTVESYSETTVFPPESGERFVGGLGVEVTDSSGNEAEANGTVSIGYDQGVVDDNNLDESSMNVYFYNESSTQWTTEGVEVVSRDLENNVVEANVSHFSTYAAFAQEREEDSQDDGGDTGSTGGGTFVTPVQNMDGQEDNQSQQENDQTDDSSDDRAQDGESNQNQTETEEQDQETENQTDQQDNPQQGVTGQFLSSPSNIAGIIVGLLVAMIAALEYFGKIELRAMIETVREKVQEVRN